MATYTANQVSINNGSKLVTVNSNESPESVSQGDFIQIANYPLAEINRTFLDANSNHIIELVKVWKHSDQITQSAIVLPTTVNFKSTVQALKNANTLVNDNTQAMQDWQTKLGRVAFNNVDGSKVTIKTMLQMETDFNSLMSRVQALIPMQAFDVYVLIGDSITNQSVENREELLKQSFIESGFSSEVEVYGTGLSGHTTKTFTEKFLGQVPPTTSSLLLSDYETLLAGKRVLFIDVLRTNDWKMICSNGVDYDVQKAECEQWTEILVNAIKASTLNADYAIASQPYNDWRNINVRGSQGFDIIDGNAPVYDQSVAWQYDVVEALCKKHSPNWYANDRCYFDFFAHTRNYFRYWLGSDNDSIHPVINTSELYRNYFARRAYKASINSISIVPMENLYDYTLSVNLLAGETCIFDFARTYSNGIDDQDGIQKDTRINLVAAGSLRETTIKKSDGSLIGGRSYLITGGENSRQTTGQGNPGNSSVSLENHYLLKSNQYVRAGEVMSIVITGLPENSVYDLSITAAYNVSSASSKVTANGVVISLSNTAVSDGIVPIATESVTVGDDGKINATLESLDGLGVGALAGISLTRTA